MSTTMLPMEDEAVAEEGGGGKLKLILVLVVALAVTAAAAWFFVLRPSGPEEPVPGEVVALEPIQINLAAGHYLRIGLALQLTETAHDVDGSKALDAAIEIFSGVEMSELTRARQRGEYKHQLEESLHESYHGDVMGVYFTEFVTQ